VSCLFLLILKLSCLGVTGDGRAAGIDSGQQSQANQSDPDTLAKVKPAAKFERSDRWVVSYKLTDEDLVQLADKDTLADKLDKLKGVSFSGQDEFWSALQKAAAPQTYDVDQYRDIIIDLARAQSSYTLSETSLEALEKMNLPDVVMEELKKLQNSQFPDKNNFEAALQPVFDKVRGEFNRYEPQIIKAAEIPRTYTLTETSLKILEEKGLPDDLLALIDKLKGQTYSDKSEFVRQIQPIIEYVTVEYNFPEPILTRLSELQTENLDSQRKGALEIIEEVIKEYNQYQELILQQVQILPGYRLSDQTYKKLKSEGMPAYINNSLHGSDGKGFASENQFKIDLGARIDALIAQYRRQIEKEAETLAIYRLTGLALNKLRQILKAREIPDAVLKVLQNKMLEVEFAYAGLFKSALREEIRSLGNQSANFENKIAMIARKEHPIDVRPDAVDWSGDDCGCVLDELSDVVVYGFYPFWMSKSESADPQSDKSDKKKVPQSLDFSVFSRIGYYALPVGTRGYLKQENAWNIREKAGFIKTAQRYRTRVDLVIYNDDWADWRRDGNIDRFTTAIVDLVKFKGFRLSDWIKFGLTTWPWRWSRSYHRVGAVADGITMDFDGYPSDPDSTQAFMDFITQLEQKLIQAGEGFDLNLMVTKDAIGNGIFNYDNLKEVLLPKDENNRLKVKLLVFLDQPTSQNKKDLRSSIEKNFRGRARMKILRNIVPVITYDGQNEEQLYDDVLYSKENFGGIGFWPLPVGQNKLAADVSEAISEVFSVPLKDMGLIQGVIAKACEFICPNRWPLRISLDILILALAGFGLLYLISCKFRNFYSSSNKYFWIFMGVLLLFILIGLSLLYCDPYYKNLREGNWPLFIVVTVVIGMTVLQYFKRVRQARNP
jgi:hypothetical protein